MGGKLVLFNGIGNDYRTIEAGGTAAEALHSLAPDVSPSSCAFLAGGQTVGADYRIQAGDVVFVREVPGASACGMILAIVSVVSAVASLGMGIYSAIKQQQAQEETEKAQRQAKAMSEQTTQLPFLKGAKNRTALGYNIPYVMGTMYDVPYKLTSGCYRISGDRGQTQEWLCAFVAGYAPLNVVSVKMGNEAIYGQTARIQPVGSNEHLSLTAFDGDKEVTAEVTFTAYTRQQLQRESYQYDAGYWSTQWPYEWVHDHWETRRHQVPHYYTHIEYSLSAPVSKAMVVKVPVDGVMHEFTIPAGAISGKSGEWESNNTSDAHPNKVSGTAVVSMPYKSIHDVEIREIGDFTNAALAPLNIKCTAVSYGEVIPHKYGDGTDWPKGLVKQLEQNTYKIDVCIMFDGLRYYDDGWCAYGCDVRVDWSNNAGNSWAECARFGIYDNVNRTIRFSRTVQFTAEQCFGKELSVRLVRETSQVEKNGQDACYLCYINCYQYDAAKSDAWHIVPCMPLEMPWRDKVTRIGICMESSDSTKDTLDEINCLVQGMARTWNAAAREWSVMKSVTRNPAAWILEVLTSSCHEASRFNDNEIDLAALGALYERCEAQGFMCDGLITEDTKKSDLLSQILTECGATMLMGADGKWTFAIEGKQTTPVALLNEQSIVSATASKDFGRKPFGLKATYTNRDTWAMDTRYMTVDGNGQIVTGAEAVYALRGGDKTKVITDSTFKYITEWPHLCRMMRRQLAKLRFQRREVTVKVGAEGDLYPLWSTVLLQTRQLCIGVSSGIVREVLRDSAGAVTIATADICVFGDVAATMGMIVQTAARRQVCLKVCTVRDARTRLLRVTGGDVGNVQNIRRGDIYSFGELDADGNFGKATSPMQITSTKQTNEGWELTLRDYSDALYENEGSIPDYKSNITIPKDSTGSVSSGEAVKPAQPTPGDKEAESIENASQAAKETTELLVSGVTTNPGNRLAPMPALSLEELVTMIDRARAECMDAIGRLREDMLTRSF